MLLKDRVAVITAGGSGMGRAAARRMAAEGATVVVADIDLDAADGTVAAISADGGSAVSRRVDVADVGQLRDLMAFVDSEFGVLHVLFNHAGMPGPAGLDITEEEWTTTIDVNLKSAWYGTALAVPLLERSEGKGSIIYTASVTALIGSPYSPLYSLTKGGVVALMRAVALKLAPGVRANAICPGPVDTPMLPRFFGREPGAVVSDEMRGFIEGYVPMKRASQPEEIAETVLYLASDMSSFVTGHAIPVDGGIIAK